MGTMYYAIIDACPTCGHGERHAICKNLSSFRAYLSSDPWGLPVTSWADWKTVLARPGVVVEDEYGHRLFTNSFITDVEAVPMDQRRRQYDAAMEFGCCRDYKSEDFLDGDGFSFHAGDFG